MTANHSYRFRLTATTREPGLFRLTESETSFELPDGHVVYIVARNGENLLAATKLHFESGGYKSREDARSAGNRLRLRLRILNAGLSLGLSVPTVDLPSGTLSSSKKEEIRSELGVTVLDNIWGLLVFPDDEKHAEVWVDANAEVHPSDTKYWLDGISQLWGDDINFDERGTDAINLLSLASLEPSPRSSFLVTYLALEQVLPTRERGAASLKLLGQLKQRIVRASERKHNPIEKAERDALTGSIGRLEHESFGSALKRLAEKNRDLQIEGMPISEFLSRCTNVRHKTAHPSKMVDNPDYGMLARGLRHITTLVLWSIYGISSLSLSRPGDQVTIPKGKLQFAAIHYRKR